MAIAWLYRDDYESKAGFPMLSVIEPEGRRSGRQALLYAIALIPVTLVPTLVGVSGMVYGVVALVLGLGLLWLAVAFAMTRTDRTARAVLRLDHLLPLLWIAMIGDKL
jgi:protoheme IX farnesyltransferase